jgi:cyclopropane-fatty-acyl-phospholipid synthase
MSPSLLRGPVVHTRPDPKELVARTSLDWVLRRVPVRAHELNGAVLGRDWGRPVPVIDLIRPADFYHRLADHPKLAVGEGYMSGEWAPAQGHDLAEVLRPFAAQVGSLAPGLWRTVRRVTERARHRRGTHPNTLSGARANIEAHYDLSNELFATFLDPTLSYSSARFDPARPFAAQALRRAGPARGTGAQDRGRARPRRRRSG